MLTYADVCGRYVCSGMRSSASTSTLFFSTPRSAAGALPRGATTRARQLYCCLTAALLLLYRFTTGIIYAASCRCYNTRAPALLLLYCCFTAALQLYYWHNICCLFQVLQHARACGSVNRRAGAGSQHLYFCASKASKLSTRARLWCRQ
jgi:hypothetical protein